MPIHPTAVIGATSEVDSSADVGPYAIVQEHVKIGPRTRIGPHAVVYSHATLGADNVLHGGVHIGDTAQSIKFDQEVPSSVEVGEGNTFREGATVHRGQEAGGVTRIGDRNYFMVNAHVGHDCQIGDGVILANCVALGGHAQIADGANLSANVLVHQYCRVGRLVMMRGGAAASLDVPPFTMTAETNRMSGLNMVGLRRADMAKASRNALRRAYRTYFLTDAPAAEALEQVEAESEGDHAVAELVAFIRASTRGVIRRLRTERRSGDAPDS